MNHPHIFVVLDYSVLNLMIRWVRPQLSDVPASHTSWSYSVRFICSWTGGSKTGSLTSLASWQGQREGRVQLEPSFHVVSGLPWEGSFQQIVVSLLTRWLRRPKVDVSREPSRTYLVLEAKTLKSQNTLLAQLIKNFTTQESKTFVDLSLILLTLKDYTIRYSSQLSIFLKLTFLCNHVISTQINGGFHLRKKQCLELQRHS